MPGYQVGSIRESFTGMRERGGFRRNLFLMTEGPGPSSGEYEMISAPARRRRTGVHESPSKIGPNVFSGTDYIQEVNGSVSSRPSVRGTATVTTPLISTFRLHAATRRCCAPFFNTGHEEKTTGNGIRGEGSSGTCARILSEDRYPLEDEQRQKKE